jgi:hypothetical protein
MMADPRKALADAVNWYEKEVKALLSTLPRFESDNKDLENFYYRSVMHYLTNRWKQDDLVLNPYYSTGGMRGGCVGAYLWDFSAGWELHFLADPQGIKRQMLYFLGLDLTRCFAFSPVDGAAFGPWYPVNEEKIIGLIYYYVTITGDAAFLNEKAGGKTVLDHAVFHALLKDDLSKPLELTDYGIDGESHLELRRGIPYHGVMPDLNGRRYLNYIRAYELTKIAGCPNPALLDRAEALKKLLKERLWNPEEKWFDFITAGKRDIRYTVQMFKLFGSPVLDKEEEEGLLSHLTGEEFLSDYGIHSLSKLDPAYDKEDIDNGGPGACSIFGPLISEKLYRAGRGLWADSIMKRILWWGRRFPYWGDSFPANYVDYRQDTPLQCTHGGVAGAQCVIFGMFGIEVSPEGGITIKPYLPEFCGEMRIRNLRLHGKTIAIEVKADSYTVSMEGREWKSELGKPIVV